jgi:hypothetical protein
MVEVGDQVKGDYLYIDSNGVLFTTTTKNSITGMTLTGVTVTGGTLSSPTITGGSLSGTAMTTSTPVNAVASTGLVTLGTKPVDGDTVTINGIAYRFKDTMLVPFDVKIGASKEATATNLVSALTATSGSGTLWYAGTTANTYVTATVDGSVLYQVDLVAVPAGAIGNGYTLATTSGGRITVSNAKMGAGGQTAGVDGTVGAQWSFVVDASYLYIAIASNTTAGANWRRMTLGSVY